MRVQLVLTPATDARSWTVLDESGEPIEVADSFLAHLTAMERSPDTVRAYAYDLRDFFTFLHQGGGLAWETVTAETLGRFVAWLRLPSAAQPFTVVALGTATPSRSVATVRRKLSAVASFLDFQARRGVELHNSLWRQDRGPARSAGIAWKPLLAHLGPRSQRVLSVAVKAERHIPESLTREEITAVLAACRRARDVLFFTLLRDTGLRAGEALGLRHEDIDTPGRLLTVKTRVNANDARAKTGGRSLPVPAGLLRAYSDYLHYEYGDLDSDYVFINLAGPTYGQPWRYDSAEDLAGRIGRRVGFAFHLHQFRHTYATDLLRRGVAAEMVQQLLGHAAVTTTLQTYAHLNAVDARRALERSGWFSDREETR